MIPLPSRLGIERNGDGEDKAKHLFYFITLKDAQRKDYRREENPASSTSCGALASRDPVVGYDFRGCLACVHTCEDQTQVPSRLAE